MSLKSTSSAKKKDRQDSLAKGNKKLALTVKVIDTGEVFSLKDVTPYMTIKELKSYLEYVTGIPVFLQRLHYLDETELQDHSDVRSHDIVTGGQLHMSIWHTWVKLIKAVVTNNITEVLKLGVTLDSTYNTPNADYMNSKSRQTWLAERAFVALFIASHRGHVKLVQTLVDSGADVNMKTKLGRTALHVSAAQGQGHIVDILLNNGADVNETDTLGETALAIAEKFGHKDGARQLFLYRWQVRAAKAEKVAQPPLYHHQQCDTANPVWLSGNQGQLYYASKDKFVDEYSGGSLHAPKAVDRALAVPTEQRVKKKISHENWLSDKEREEEQKMAAAKAEKAAKKLEEEKKKEQNMIDKESYDTWVKKQQERKERQALHRQLAQANKSKQNNKDSSKGNNSLQSSENFENEKDNTGSNLTELLAHLKINNSTGTAAEHEVQPQYGEFVSNNGFLFQNNDEAIEKVKNIQTRRAADKRYQGYIPSI